MKNFNEIENLSNEETLALYSGIVEGDENLISGAQEQCLCTCSDANRTRLFMCYTSSITSLSDCRREGFQYHNVRETTRCGSWCGSMGLTGESYYFYGYCWLVE